MTATSPNFDPALLPLRERVKRRIQAWLAETHGTRFELTRHFLARLFDSELVATPGEWAKVAGGLVAILSCVWLLLARTLKFKYEYLVGNHLSHRIAAEVRNDELTLVVLSMCATMILAALIWDSLYPTLRDYLALAAMPLAPRDIFLAKLTAVMLVFAVFVGILILPAAVALTGASGGHAPLGATFGAMTGGCVVAFFGLIALQGLLLNFLPDRWFDRISIWVQALLVTGALGGFFFLAWKAPMLLAGFHIPPAVAAGVPVAAAAIYLLSYHRYRRLLLEAPLPKAPERRDRLTFLLELWIRDPREQAAFSFLWKTLGRSRVHRLALLIYAGLGVAWVAKTTVQFLSAPVAGARLDKFLVMTAPLTVAMFTLLGLRYLFALPANLRANWMFQITEREGRRAWLSAVERFVIWCGLAPVLAVGMLVVARQEGVAFGLAWGTLSSLLGAILFEYLFRRWRKLPFTCSYLPGKRPLIYTLGLYIGLMPVVIPVAFILGACSSNPVPFLTLLAIELAVWWRMRTERQRVWAVFPLRYEEQHDTDVDTYELAGDGTTLAQEQFQREWSDFLRSGPDVPIVRPLDEGETRLGRLWEWLRAVPRDLLYAIRVLAKSPAFAGTEVLTLALGLGLNAAFFTVFHSFVLKPVAVRDPGGLVQWTFRTRDNHPVGPPLRDFALMRSSVRALSDSAATATYATSLDGHPSRVALVTDNYFTLLGVGAARGRTLQEGEAEPVLVLSHRTWLRSFGADPGIVGKRLRVHGVPFEVVGVAAPEFDGHDQSRSDGWVPIQVWDRMPNLPHDYDLAYLGRMRTGVWKERAEATLTAYARRLGAEQQEYSHLFRAEVESLSIPIPWAVFRYFVPLLVAMCLTMAIPCANAANMMLARAMARQRELGVRLSLGASRGRVIRQLLTEGMVIALVGGTAGLVLARSALGFFERLFYSTAPPTILFRFRVPKVELDFTVYLYLLAVAGLTTVAFALAPAAQATKAAVSAVLRGDFAVWRISRTRDVLVVGQVAVCAGLLILTGALLRGSHRIATIERGYDPNNVFAVIGQDHRNARALHPSLVSRPWVETAAFLGSPFTAMRTLAVGDASRSGHQTAYYNRGSAEFFRLMRVPVVRGRTFTAEEAARQAAVAVVSETAARQLWRGQDPIGKTLSIAPEQRRYEWRPPFDQAVVVGVCGDIVRTAADRGPRASVYFPAGAEPGMVVAVRGRGTSEQTVRSLEEVVAGSDGGIQGARVASLQETLDWESYPYLAASWLSSILGALALLLTSTGVYGVMSYLVSQRTKEIGVRLALGATRSQVVQHIISYTAKLAGPGLVLGVVLAVGAAKYFVASFGTTIDVADIVSYAGGLVVVTVSTLIAVAGPARRAAEIDPIASLRAE